MYFENGLTNIEIKIHLDVLCKINALFANAEVKKKAMYDVAQNTNCMPHHREKARLYIKKYPKLIARIERMFQQELFYLLDVEHLVKNHLADVSQDVEFEDVIELYDEEYETQIDDAVKDGRDYEKYGYDPGNI